MTTTSAVSPYTVHPGEGEAAWYLGSLFEWKARGADTGGELAAVETTVQPGGEPPLHVHEREDEVFLVLNGKITFQLGDERVDAEPGAWVFAPRGVPHGFAVRTDVARMLNVMTPAGLEPLFDRFSEPAGERTLPPLPAGPPDMEAMTAAMTEHGVTIVGPPLPVLL